MIHVLMKSIHVEHAYVLSNDIIGISTTEIYVQKTHTTQMRTEKNGVLANL